MRKANYASVRGTCKYGNNHFPIQDCYLQEAVGDASGGYTLRTTAVALKDHQDLYHQLCPINGEPANSQDRIIAIYCDITKMPYKWVNSLA
jgi:hypothetical protein